MYSGFGNRHILEFDKDKGPKMAGISEQPTILEWLLKNDEDVRRNGPAAAIASTEPTSRPESWTSFPISPFLDRFRFADNPGVRSG